MEKLFFPHFGLGLKTRSQFRSACKNQREFSGNKNNGPNAKVLKTMPGKCGKNQGKNNFSPTFGFDSKTRSQLRSKTQREISSNKVRRLLWPLGGR